jgi:hypothetical protein
MRAQIDGFAGDSPSRSTIWHTGVYDTGVALLEGRFDVVEQMARDALLVGKRIDHPFAQACFNGQIMHLLRDRGELEELHGMLENATHGRRTPTHWIKAVLGQNAAAIGRERQAREVWDDLAQYEFDDVTRAIRWIGTMVQTAHLCADVNDGERAKTLIGLLDPVEHQHGVLPVPVQYGGPVTWCLARLHETLGQADEALQLYEEAIEATRRLGARPTLARVQLGASRLLARKGDPGRAKALAAESAQLAAELGMARL